MQMMAATLRQNFSVKLIKFSKSMGCFPLKEASLSYKG